MAPPQAGLSSQWLAAVSPAHCSSSAEQQLRAHLPAQLLLALCLGLYLRCGRLPGCNQCRHTGLVCLAAGTVVLTPPCRLAVLYSLHQAWLAGVGAGLLLPAYQEAAAAAALLVGAGACSPLLLPRPAPSSAARCCSGSGALIKLRPHSFGRNKDL